MRDLASFLDIRCQHDWKTTKVVSHWIWLECKNCLQTQQVMYYNGTYAKYCVIPYLLKEENDLTETAEKRIKRFMKNNRQLVLELLRIEKIDAEILEKTFENNSKIMQGIVSRIEEAIIELEES